MGRKGTARGRRRRGHRWEVYVRVGGVLHARTFPLDTPPEVMEAWRLNCRLDHLTAPLTYAEQTRHATFAEDVAEYLRKPAVSTLTTASERAYHLGLWLDELGHTRTRASITTDEIDAVLHRWAKTLAPQTVRLRRKALSHVWTLLDAKGAANPVAASWQPPKTPAVTRTLDYRTIARLLAVLPVTKTKARLGVLSYTGLPPSSLGRLTPADVNLKARTLTLPAREKGAGTEPVTVPLIRLAVQAFRLFAKLGCWGPFSTSSVRKTFLRAVDTLKRRKQLPADAHIRVYDLRHSYAARLYAVTGDLDTVRRFLGHADLETTRRYARASVVQVDRTAARKLDAELETRKKPKQKARNR